MDINSIKILGIESSCDDTSVALIEATPTPPSPPSGRGGNFKILAEKTASQIEVHKKYGGVVPEIAGRMHAEKILPVIETVLKQTSTTPPHPPLVRVGKNNSTFYKKDREKILLSPSAREGVQGEREKPDVIAVTAGPGLITGLLVGVEAAKALSYLWQIPLIGINHLEGHIHSVEIPPLNPPLNKGGAREILYPALALVVSGGHSEIILSKQEGKYKKIGGTRDDAAGECFDKVAKLLGFTYPGGPKISEYARQGNPKAIKFPRPMLNSDNFDMSFSGLKTSALYWLRDNKLVLPLEKVDQPPLSPPCQGGAPTGANTSDFCASFEQAIIDVLVDKTLKAVNKYQPKTVILAGGVSANKKLRETLGNKLKENFPASHYLIPNPKYAIDNATMIAIAGYYHVLKKDFTPWQKLKANPNWKIYNN